MQNVTEVRRDQALRELSQDRRLRVGIGIGVFVAAMTVAAYVTIPVPWSPVPVTLQPMVALLAGAVLGPMAGAAAMASYLALGAAGAPVFAGGMAGLPWLVGPTGGYLMAFPVAALVVGLIGGSGGTLRLAVGLLAGLATIYLGGVAQLSVLTGEGLGTVLALGVVPFVLADLVKVALALALAKVIRAGGLGR